MDSDETRHRAEASSAPKLQVIPKLVTRKRCFPDINKWLNCCEH